MRFEDWEPIYHEILRDFGFSAEEDEKAALQLAELLIGKRACDEDCLAGRIGGEVTVCGNAHCLGHDIDARGLRGTVIAADGATSELMRRGVVPDLIVTDLDGEIAPQVEANRAGAVAVIHAHGDNREALALHVPRFEGLVMGTTQSRPFGSIRNFGGFTDGDRAVLLARHFGAERVLLLGFDYLSPRKKMGRDRRLKAKKLLWAKRLIEGVGCGSSEP